MSGRKMPMTPSATEIVPQTRSIARRRRDDMKDDLRSKAFLVRECGFFCEATPV
jgi:hypothetical protein